MKKKIVKYIIISIVVLIILIASFIVYKNLFASSESSRYEGIENYKLTNNEINSVKDKIKELENIKDIDIYIDSKIIKIVVKLKEDVNFEELKKKANESISGFDEENLTFYDVQFFVQSENKESEVYPQIGYKFKANKEFSW